MPTTPETNRARHGRALLYTVILLALFTVVQSVFYLCGYEFESDLYRHGPFSALTAAVWITATLGAILINLLLPKMGALVDEVEYADQVTVHFAVKDEHTEPLWRRISEISNGKCVPEKTGERYDYHESDG